MRELAERNVDGLGVSGIAAQRTGRRLTVNLGVRYDVMPYASEMHNRLANFDPATRTLSFRSMARGPAVTLQFSQIRRTLLRTFMI